MSATSPSPKPLGVMPERPTTDKKFVTLRLNLIYKKIED